MIFEQRVYDLLSYIDRLIEEAKMTEVIERDVKTQLGENGESQRIDIYALDRKRAREEGVLPQIERTAIQARAEAARLGFDTSPVRPAKDRPACRFFEVQG